jgi:hypothetical protein
MKMVGGQRLQGYLASYWHIDVDKTRQEIQWQCAPMCGRSVVTIAVVRDWIGMNLLNLLGIDLIRISQPSVTLTTWLFLPHAYLAPLALKMMTVLSNYVLPGCSSSHWSKTHPPLVPLCSVWPILVSPCPRQSI